jgi:cytochrome c556
MKSLISLGVVAAVAVVAPMTASAQFAKKEDALKYRQSALQLTGQHMGRIGAMMKGDIPFNAAEVQKSANVIATLSTLPWEAFGPDTDGGKAKPAIWKETDKFKAASERYMKVAVELNTAAKSANLEQIRKVFGATQQTCRACHDDYRER